MVDGPVRAGAGRRFREAEPLAIDYRQRHGHRRSRTRSRSAPTASSSSARCAPAQRGKTEFDKLEYSLYQRAGDAAFRCPRRRRGRASDATTASKTCRCSTDESRRTGRQKAEEMLAGIAAGDFRPDPTPSPARAARISSSVRRPRQAPLDHRLENLSPTRFRFRAILRELPGSGGQERQSGPHSRPPKGVGT